MFLDVRDFTPFAERSTARETVAFLNDFFELVVPIVLAHGGHANKFMGDGLLGGLRGAGAPPRPRRPRARRRMRDRTRGIGPLRRRGGRRHRAQLGTGGGGIGGRRRAARVRRDRRRRERRRAGGAGHARDRRRRAVDGGDPLPLGAPRGGFHKSAWNAAAQGEIRPSWAVRRGSGNRRTYDTRPFGPHRRSLNADTNRVTVLRSLLRAFVRPPFARAHARAIAAAVLAGVLVAAAPGGNGSAHAKRYDKQRGGTEGEARASSARARAIRSAASRCQPAQAVDAVACSADSGDESTSARSSAPGDLATTRRSRGTSRRLAQARARRPADAGHSRLRRAPARRRRQPRPRRPRRTRAQLPTSTSAARSKPRAPRAAAAQRAAAPAGSEPLPGSLARARALARTLAPRRCDRFGCRR